MDSHIKVLVRVDGTWDTLGNFSSNFQYKTKRSNRTVLHVVCIDDRCSWVVRAVSLDNSPLFQIRRKVIRDKQR
ncbi:unnamed protein product [Cuscuta campestris]|uniref:Uncharacterized protein n=1 Tax=Cuscuta campestris TaxID=132261 RepID=A0A484M6I5_9ASTE|nr:unnamed protein product [Cuscuta campestris]